MNRVNEMIYALRQCAKEHENDVVYTGQIVTSSLCRDVADYLNADRWHYPSKGEYPKNSEDVLCCYEHDIKAIGNYYASDGIWYCDALLQPYKVPLAWQYIVPPKEEV